MSEFSSEVELVVRPEPSSLRSTRTTIQKEIGDVEVTVAPDVQGASSKVSSGSGGSRIAGRERAMSRQLQSAQNDHLAYNVELDETRNDLLRELIDETESGNFTRARMGGLGGLGMLGGGLGLAAAGAAMAPAIAGSVGEAIGSIDIGGSIDEIVGEVSASELVTGTVGASSVLVGSVAASTLITGSVAAPALITGTVGASALISGAVPASDLVVGTVGASALITGTVGASALIVGTVTAASLIEGTIGINDLIDIPEGGIDLKSLILGGGAAAGGAAAGARFVQGAGATGGGAASAGVGFPVLTPEMIPRGSFADRSLRSVDGSRPEPSILTARGRQQRLGGFGEWLNAQLGTQVNESRGGRETARERSDRRRAAGVTVNNSVDVARRSDRDIERIVDRKLEKFKRELEREIARL